MQEVFRHLQQVWPGSDPAELALCTAVNLFDPAFRRKLSAKTAKEEVPGTPRENEPPTGPRPSRIPVRSKKASN